jgi:hypothetical protein
MPKLTDTQTIILSRAATRRPGNLAMPLPEGLHGAAANMAVTRMITHGWLEEIDATPVKGAPLWRETGDGHGMTLIATDAGLEVIGIEPVVVNAVTNRRSTMRTPELAPEAPAAPKPVAIRSGTKQAQIIALLQRPEGASIAEIVAATAWQAHTARGAISGVLKKRLGLSVTTVKEEGRGAVYRIA